MSGTEWKKSHDVCLVPECENDATHWGKMCDEHAKEKTGHPDRVANKNGEI